MYDLSKYRKLINKAMNQDFKFFQKSALKRINKNDMPTKIYKRYSQMQRTYDRFRSHESLRHNDYRYIIFALNQYNKIHGSTPITTDPQLAAATTECWKMFLASMSINDHKKAAKKLGESGLFNLPKAYSYIITKC